MSALGALVGLTVAAGVLLLLRYALTPTAAPGGTPGPDSRPPSRARRRAAAARARFTRREQLLLAAAAALGLLTALLTGWLVAPVVLPLLAWGLPRILFPPKSTQVETLEALEEWTRRLSSLFVAGQYLTETLTASLRSCPRPLQAPVERLVARLQARQPPAAALYSFADDLDDETGDMIAATLIKGSTEDGTALGRILDELATMVAREVAVRRQVTTAQSAPRGEARLVTLISIASVAGLILLLPYGQYYLTPTGQLTLAALLAAFVAVIAWIHKIATPTPAPRFLIRPKTSRP